MKKVLLISLLILIVASIFVVYKFVLLRDDATEIEFIPTDTPQFHLPDGARARIGRGRLNKMSISPDNSVLAVASGIGIWLYDLQSGEALKLLMPHTSNVSAIAFSPNSNILASGSTDNIVRLWDIDSGELLHTFIGHIGGIFDIVFSPDGKMLASASINAINVWDMSTRTHKQRYRYRYRRLTYSIRSRIAFNDDELFVAEVNHSEPQTKIVLTYPVSNFTEPHKKTLEAPKHTVRDVSLSPDGEFLLSEGYRNSFLLWEVDTGKQRKIINGDTDDVLGVFFSADGKSLVSVDKNRDLHIWDIATEKKKKTIKGNFNSRHNAEIICNGGSIVNKNKNGTIRLFNIDNDLSEITITGHPIWTFFDVSFNPNGSVAATHNGRGVKIYIYGI